MPVFECNLCKKIFTLKSDLERHKKKKTPCIPADQLIETFKDTIVAKVTDEVKTNMTTEKEKKEIECFLKKCHDILRDNEGIVTMDALNNLSMLLFLRLINKHVKDGTIDLMDIKKYRTSFPSERYYLIQYVLFENIIENGVFKLDPAKLPETIEFIFKAILWYHPKTRELFKDRYPQIKYKSTYETIFKMMSKIEWDEMQSDIKGMAYEMFLSSELTGGDLGQFFTKREVIDYIVNEMDPKVGETFIDPAMGTCGFITRMYNKVKPEYVKNNIPLDQNVVNNIMNGVEKNPGTTLLGLNNCLITTGYFPKNVIHGDSIRNYNKVKYDIVVSNPPFGIKGLKYENLPSDYNNIKKDTYLPIKSNDAVCLFIQAIYHMMKDGGRAAIIIPDGQQMNGSKNKTFTELRKFLIEKCNLYKIVKLPSGTFLPYTGVETMILFFRKGCKTSKVNFYNLKNNYMNEDKIITITYDEMINKNFTLDYKKYIKMVDDFTINSKHIKDICNIKKGTLQSCKCKEGIYTFITASNNFKTHNEYAEDCEAVFFVIGAEGSLGNVHYYKGKFIASDLVLVIKSNNDQELLNRYVYYYLKLYSKNIVVRLKSGAVKKSINIGSFQDLKIPIPSIQIQQQIITELDAIYNTIEACNKVIDNMKTVKQAKFNNVISNMKNKFKRLQEMCDINYGTRITKSNNTEGIYPVYGSGEFMFTTNTFNRQGFNILIGRFGVSEKCVRLITNKIFLNDSGLTVTSTNKGLLNKYLGYYLYNNQFEIYNICRGAAQKNLDVNEFKQFKIKIPSLEDQQRIIKEMEELDNFEEQINKQIKSLEMQAKETLERHLKLCKNDSETDMISEQMDDIIEIENEGDNDEDEIIKTHPRKKVNTAKMGNDSDEDEIIKTLPRKKVNTTKMENDNDEDGTIKAQPRKKVKKVIKKVVNK